MGQIAAETGNPQTGTGIAFQPVNNSQNSITNFEQGAENTLAQTGLNQQAAGTANINAGLPAQSNAVDNITQVLNHYNAIMNGSRSEVGGQLQSQIDPITQQFAQIRNMFSQNNQRGGGATSAAAAAPYQETAQVSNLINGAKNNAAQQATGAATAEADAGKGISQIGLQQLLAGNTQLNSAEQDALSRYGINVQQSDANKQLASSLASTLAGALL